MNVYSKRGIRHRVLGDRSGRDRLRCGHARHGHRAVVRSDRRLQEVFPGGGQAVNAEQPEIWRTYPYAVAYEVSNLGEVRSLFTRYGKSRPAPKLLRGSGLDRYRSVQLGMVHHRVHLMVLETFVGPRPLGHQACHNNGDASDNRLSNLRWGTVADNTIDKRRHGTQIQGSRVASAKLTEADIPPIHARFGEGESIAQLARDYRVTRRTIRDITTGKAWRHVG